MKNLNKITAAFVLGISMVSLPVFADGGKPSVKHAKRELNEAKEILAKLTPDADGHIAKASQDVDQALQELSAVKPAPKKQ